MSKAGYVSLLMQKLGYALPFNAQFLLGMRVFRVLRVSKLVFRVAVVRNVIMLAFSSLRSILTIIFLLLYTITLFAIIALHVFYSCEQLHSNTAETRSTGFTSFGEAFLAVMQIVTGSNWGGLSMGYMGCQGYIATTYFAFIYFVCNFFVLNLFVAIFLENFELSDEAKAVKQVREVRMLRFSR